MAIKKVKNTGFRKYIIRLWMLYVASVAMVVLLFVGISAGLLGFMPSFEELENPKSFLASEVISADQKLLGSYFIENRTISQFSDLSPNLINALIATEDIRFHNHPGIDGRALLRVMFGLVTGTDQGGGSTITQQLAKNLFPRRPNQTFFGMVITKLKEWVVAVKLERNYSKQEILAMYLNTVDFGSHSFGVASAARTFFDKTPAELTVEESALLVGILKAPTRFSPVRNPERALARRNVVLSQMARYGFITASELETHQQMAIDLSRFRLQDHRAGQAPYMREYLRVIMHAQKPEREQYRNYDNFVEDSIQWADNPLYGWIYKNPKPDGSLYNLYKDGLRIYTTINSRMQQHAEAAVKEHLSLNLQPAFFKHWRGSRNAPFDFPPEIASEGIENIMKQAMRRTDRYRNLRRRNVPADSIEIDFNTLYRMR
ncbi:MAG TPA: transglycosylase domain-containing protein, partial [Bacteroidales bacterium]|nr:transglycosylase domain-containing protein [Bacteroidales bacterium]